MNEQETCTQTDPKLTQAGSRPVRYRLIDKDGKAYPPFVLKPGASLCKILTGAFPGRGDYELERA